MTELSSADVQRVVGLLEEVPLFGGMSQDELRCLTDLLTEQEYGKGAPVFSVGDPGDALYIVGEGEVKVSLSSESGREIILDTLETGSFFGEMSLVDGEARSANVSCTKKSNLLKLSRREFLKAVRSYPSIAINVMTELCVRLRRADESIENLALLDVFGRVARFLIERAEEEGDDVEEGFLIRKMPTQQHIGSCIGTSRETVSRALSDFQRRGFVEQRGRGLLVREGFTVKAVTRSSK
jgi:CRP/FNR family cyclic AMP-dependent transcriptional regulator